MSGDSVPQSYSHLLLSITYNAPAGASDLVFAQANLASKGTQAKPTKAGEAKLRVKAASDCHLQGCQTYSVKLPRMSGSFDF